MEPRLEDLTKEQLIAELNVANEKLKYYRTIEDHARTGIQLSPQELSARLAIAEANLAARQQELVLVYKKNKHLIDRLDQFEEQEKKREFERRLAEATDFLKADGYEVRRVPSAPLFPTGLNYDGKTDNSIFEIDMSKPHLQAPWTISGGPPSEIHLESPKTRVIRAGVELKWTGEDMLNFALQWYMGPPRYGKNVHAVFESFVKSH